MRPVSARIAISPRSAVKASIAACVATTWTVLIASGGNADVDWAYRVFDLPETASDAEIDRAYRRMMGQYHPDRVAGAAPDLQKLAETKSREINAAYDRIRKLRKQ